MNSNYSDGIYFLRRGFVLIKISWYFFNSIHQLINLEGISMAKGKDAKKDVKKKSEKSLKEKRAAKKEKKAGK